MCYRCWVCVTGEKESPHKRLFGQIPCLVHVSLFLHPVPNTPAPLLSNSQPTTCPSRTHTTHHNAEGALFDVITLLDASVAKKAEPLAAEFLEYLELMDYNKYFDAMPSRKVGLC